MMNEKLDQIITQISIDTLEKLAFMFAFPEDDGDETIQAADVNGYVHAGVAFSGPFDGTLAIEMTLPELSELTVNMLGLDTDHEVTAEQRHDALKETLNVICGNMLPAIAGKQAVFNIEVPRIREPNESAAADSEQQPCSMVRLNLEVGRCCLYLFVDGRLPADMPC
jgi:hypothetical protein